MTAFTQDFFQVEFRFTGEQLGINWHKKMVFQERERKAVVVLRVGECRGGDGGYFKNISHILPLLYF